MNLISAGIFILYILLKAVQVIITVIKFEDPTQQHGDIIKIIFLLCFLGTVATNFMNWHRNHKFLYGEIVFLFIALAYLLFMVFGKNIESGDGNKEGSKSVKETDINITIAAVVIFIQCFVLSLVTLIGNPYEFSLRLRNNFGGNNGNESNTLPLADLPPPYSEENITKEQEEKSSTPPPKFKDVIKSSSESTLSRRSSQVSTSSQSSVDLNKGTIAKSPKRNITRSPRPTYKDSNKSTSNRTRHSRVSKSSQESPIRRKIV